MSRKRKPCECPPILPLRALKRRGLCLDRIIPPTPRLALTPGLDAVDSVLWMNLPGRGKLGRKEDRRSLGKPRGTLGETTSRYV